MRLVWVFDCLQFAQYISMSLHKIECKQTWCKKIYNMKKATWLNPMYRIALANLSGYAREGIPIDKGGRDLSLAWTPILTFSDIVGSQFYAQLDLNDTLFLKINVYVCPSPLDYKTSDPIMPIFHHMLDPLLNFVKWPLIISV